MAFAVLISDLNLPDGDGVELVRQAKEVQRIKAIAVTGRDTEQERIVGLKAGFDHYLTKPLNFAELQRAVNSP